MADMSQMNRRPQDFLFNNDNTIIGLAEAEDNLAKDLV